MAPRNLLTAIAGRPLRDGRRYHPFFIVGSGRCGTTLLRAILDAHPRIHIPPETYVLGGAMREFRLFSRLPWPMLLRMVLSRLEYHKNFHTFGVSLRPLYQELLDASPRDQNLAFVLDAFYRYHAASVKPSADRWGDKTPTAVYQLNRILNVFPDAVVIHMLRDGRDVVRSFLDAGFLKTATIEHASSLWSEAVRTAREFGRTHPEQFVEVRYEELVTAPEEHIRNICSKIDVEYTPAMLQHHHVDRDLGDVSHFAFHANVRKPITAKSVGSWKEKLAPEDAEKVVALLREDLVEFGYSV